jgi:serine protease Do
MTKRSIIIALLALFLLVSIGLPGCILPQITIQTQLGETKTSVSTPAAAPATDSAIIPDYTLPAVSSGSTVQNKYPDLASVISKVKPSVVAINTIVPAYNIFGGSFTQEGAGSGWILDKSGLIVTNNHVVEGVNSITVTLEDGRNYSADLVRTDAVSDLAVVKISAENLPPAIMIGDSSAMRVGDWVIAIGNQLGQGIAASEGIISAKGVSLSADNGETLYDLIQTTAAINPGNSGGPLVNLAGEVIGINSIKVAQVGVEGMGYSISTKVAMPIITELISKGFISRPWLGLGLYTVNETVYLRYKLAVDKGVLVTEVVNGGPSDQAGIKTGDIITSISGVNISSVDELVKEVRSFSVGSSIEITFWRGQTQQTTTVKLEQSPVQ